MAFLGELRFRAPKSPAKVSGVQKATTQPTQCFQALITGAAGQSTTSPFRKQSVSKRDVGPTNEDCLFLK